MRFNYSPDMTINGMITYLKVSDIGCDTAQYGPSPTLASEVIANKFTTPAIGVLSLQTML